MFQRDLEITRSLDDATVTYDGTVLRGRAISYGVTSNGPVPIEDGGERLYEQIDPGAFDDLFGTDGTLTRNVSFVDQHGRTEVGDTESGTLRLIRAKDGIDFELKVPVYSKQLQADIAAGIVKGMSFAARHPRFEVRKGIRHITKAELTHISSVYLPAYKTEVKVVKPANKLRMKMKMLDLMSK